MLAAATGGSARGRRQSSEMIFGIYIREIGIGISLIDRDATWQTGVFCKNLTILVVCILRCTSNTFQLVIIRSGSDKSLQSFIGVNDCVINIGHS